MLILRDARIMSLEKNAEGSCGLLAIEGERIVAIEKKEQTNAFIKAHPSARVVSVDNAYIVPGFIDAHSHLGLFNDGLDSEGSDGNEDTDPVTPHLRALDGIYAADVCFKEAYEGGVSLAMVGPGSANVFGGQFALVKTYEKTADDALIEGCGAQKIALGENPKRVYGREKKSPATRMATAAVLRETLTKACEYRYKWDAYEEKKKAYDRGELDDAPDRPDIDFQLESLMPVIRGEIMIKAHVHRQDDILTAIRICDEFGLSYTLEHATEGYEIADVLADVYRRGRLVKKPGIKGQGILKGVIVGPIIGDRSKPELSKMALHNAAKLCEAGVPVAVMTDHPCVPQQYLGLSAALCVKGGMSESDALFAITRVPATMLGIDRDYGTLTVGKYADLSVFFGHPLDVRSTVKMFIGHGRICYDPSGMSQI